MVFKLTNNETTAEGQPHTSSTTPSSPASTPTSYERPHIQRLLPRHFKIVEFVLAGASNVQIAEMLGMTPVGIGLIVNSPLFQDEVARRRRVVEKRQDEVDGTAVLSIREKLEKHADKAVDKLGELLEDPESRVRLMAIDQILKNTYAPAKSGQGGGVGVTINISADKVQLLQLALIESRPEPACEGGVVSPE